MIPIRTGAVIFIPPGPDYPHHSINTSNADLKYLSISMQERPEMCEYPGSGKVSAPTASGGTRLIQRLSASLDHWDGED